MPSGLLNNNTVASAGYRVFYKDKTQQAVAPSPSVGGDLANANGFKYLGEVSEEGITERIRRGGEEIKTSSLGEGTTVDFVYTGQDRFLAFTLNEYNREAVKALVYDYTQINSNLAEDAFNIGQPGSLASQFAGELKLVPVFANAPARFGSVTNSKIIHYYCAAVSSGEEISLAMQQKLLKVPVVMQLLPVELDSNGFAYGEYTSSI